MVSRGGEAFWKLPLFSFFLELSCRELTTNKSYGLLVWIIPWAILPPSRTFFLFFSTLIENYYGFISPTFWLVDTKLGDSSSPGWMALSLVWSDLLCTDIIELLYFVSDLRRELRTSLLSAEVILSLFKLDPRINSWCFLSVFIFSWDLRN